MSALPQSTPAGSVPVRLQAAAWRRALRLAGRLLFRWAENNDDPRFDRNGEAWLLRALLRQHAAAAPGRPFVLFDVGANAGDYTAAALAAARAAGVTLEVHAFEPSPASVARLEQTFPDRAAVRIVASAVGETAGRAALHDGAAGSSQASLVRRDVHAAPADAALSVPVVRLDAYLREAGVARIDLLKLDVEGFELAALRGLGDALTPAVVAAVQFEYGGATLDARAALRDFAALFAARGYRLAKLFPGHLEAREYREWMDNFSYANYVALPRPA